MTRTPNAAAGAPPPDIAALSFEQALAELEGIVRELESGKGALEASVTAEQKIQAIVDGPAGPSLRDVE
jgi:exodeoxyribonuclease VII small subunit